MTKNLSPGESVYGEKRISVDTPGSSADEATTKIEYRVWNPFRSKLAAGILGGLDDIFIKPGAKVLYIGAASGTSVSHVADIVGPTGNVYAVEFSHRSGRDLINMAKKRTNVIPIIEDARHPMKYRMLVGMVDVVFADVAQPDQARIVGLNCHLFLKDNGGVLVSVKANCIDSTAAPEAVFAREVQKMREERIKPLEQLTLGMFFVLLSLACMMANSLEQNPSRETIAWSSAATSARSLESCLHWVLILCTWDEPSLFFSFCTTYFTFFLSWEEGGWGGGEGRGPTDGNGGRGKAEGEKNENENNLILRGGGFFLFWEKVLFFVSEWW